MVEAFKYVGRAPPKFSAMEFVILEGKGGLPPSVLGPDAVHPGKHAIKLPSSDPRAEVGEPRGCPPAVKVGEDEEDPIGERVGGFLGVFGKEGGLSFAEVLRPGVPGFDHGEQEGEPIVGVIRQKGEIGRGEPV